MPSEDKTKKTTGDPFIASLDAQIVALKALREAYLAVRSVGAFGYSGDVAQMTSTTQGIMYSGSNHDAPVELPTGAFLNMSIPDAIKLYLSAVKKKQTAREIAAALKEGGMESTAANWETTVTGALHRLKSAGAVLRFKDGWGLADHYPDSLRARIAKEKPTRGRPRKKKAAKTAKARAIRVQPEPEAEAKAS
jgi:hypothetical protein